MLKHPLPSLAWVTTSVSWSGAEVACGGIGSAGGGQNAGSTEKPPGLSVSLNLPKGKRSNCLSLDEHLQHTRQYRGTSYDCWSFTHRSSASLKWRTFPETHAGEQEPPCGSPLRLTMDLKPLRKYPHSLSNRRSTFIYQEFCHVYGSLQKLILLSGNYEGQSNKA